MKKLASHDSIEKKQSRWTVASLVVLVCAIGSTYVVMAAEESPYVYRIAHGRQPITIDGAVHSTEWAHAQQVHPVHLIGPDEPTVIRLAYDDHWLYFAVVCEDSQITPVQDDFWKNDSVQFNLSLGQRETSRSHGFNFRITPHKLMSARFHRGPSPPMRETVDITKPLDPSLYRFATAKTDTGWSCELALAWSAVDPNIPTIAEPFRAHIERRNINGDKIGVSDWPYSSPVVFEFVESATR